MPNQKQDTPVFNVDKTEPQKESIRALPFHTTYDGAEIVTETEADELLEKANEFRAFVEDWISREHPTYKS